MQLPLISTNIQALSQLMTKWKSILDPIIKNKSLQSSIIENVPLINGTNVINHLLGRPLSGWRIVRLRATASIHDTQDTNPTPQLTLVLISNAAVVADVEVF